MYRMIKKKAERVECPKCYLVAYKISAKSNDACPICGCVFSWKIADKKSFESERKRIYSHGLC